RSVAWSSESAAAAINADLTAADTAWARTAACTWRPRGQLQDPLEPATRWPSVSGKRAPGSARRDPARATDAMPSASPRRRAILLAMAERIEYPELRVPT